MKQEWIKRLLTVCLVLLLAATMGMAQDAKTLYREGKALYDQKDYAAALPKLRAAAEKGHKKAQYRLGRCYQKGHAVAKDREVAFQWYQKSARQDYAKAQLALAKCYLKGKGTAADEKKAKTWLSRAVKNEKDGEAILTELKEEAAAGDEDAVALLRLLK